MQNVCKRKWASEWGAGRRQHWTGLLQFAMVVVVAWVGQSIGEHITLPLHSLQWKTASLSGDVSFFFFLRLQNMQIGASL